MFTGLYGVSVGFPCNVYLRAVRITEKPYPIVILGFSLQSVNITGFPQKIPNFSLRGV